MRTTPSVPASSPPLFQHPGPGRGALSARLLSSLAVLLALLAGCRQQAQLAPPVVDRAVDAFVDTLEANTFRYFWETTDPATGLAPDRYPRRTFSSVAAVGFALTAYPIGAERGYVTREEAAARVLTALRYFWQAPQGTDPLNATGHKGFFYHFLDLDTGLRYRNVELSSIDTALMMAGVLFNQSYFDGSGDTEAAIRAYADSLYRRVEWDWIQPRAYHIGMSWDPDIGFPNHDYQGYNEAMLLYLLALGSPTYPVHEDSWDAYTSTYAWGDFYGQEHLNFSPLFGHQYSHVWVDFRGIQDAYMREKGIDYFQNSRRATYSQQAYAIANPAGWKDYGADIWGLTASDGPVGGEFVYNGEPRRFNTYWARGASLRHINDDGTLSPTAAGGSIAFAPEIVVPTLKAMRARYGDTLFTDYGFLDAFNPSFTFTDATLQHGSLAPGIGWVDGDYLGIDQGPILTMIENFRSELVWEMMKRNPYLVRGLRRAGFTGGWLDEQPPSAPVTVRPQAEIQRLKAEDDGVRIIVLGSSTAEGVGPKTAANTWVNRYRTYAQALNPDLRVLNMARGGYTTYQLLPTGTATPEGRPQPDTLRNITRALRRNPAAIIINLPSNDTAAGFSVADQLRNYDAITAAAQAAGVPVWITTTLPRNLSDTQRRELVALRDSTFARYGDHAVDIWTGIARPDGTLDPVHDAGDHLHLNDAAHALLFERVKAAGLVEMLTGARVN